MLSGPFPAPLALKLLSSTTEQESLILRDAKTECFSDQPILKSPDVTTGWKYCEKAEKNKEKENCS